MQRSIPLRMELFSREAGKDFIPGYQILAEGYLTHRYARFPETGKGEKPGRWIFPAYPIENKIKTSQMGKGKGGRPK